MQLEGGEESGEIDQMLLPCALQCHIVLACSCTQQGPRAQRRARQCEYCMSQPVMGFSYRVTRKIVFVDCYFEFAVFSAGEAYTEMELYVRCQQNLFQDHMGHPVRGCM